MSKRIEMEYAFAYRWKKPEGFNGRVCKVIKELGAHRIMIMFRHNGELLECTDGAIRRLP